MTKAKFSVNDRVKVIRGSAKGETGRVVRINKYNEYYGEKVRNLYEVRLENKSTFPYFSYELAPIKKR